MARQKVISQDAGYIHVYREDGTAVALVPGEPVPAWAKDQVVDVKADGSSRGIYVDADTDTDEK